MIRKLLNPSFIPESGVLDEYFKLKEKQEEKATREKKKAPFNFFERVYVGSENLEEDYCVFSLEFWNINKLMLEDISRTTNSAEGWHRSLNSDVVISHPNLIRFIEAMKEEEESVRTQFIRLTSGLSFLIYAVIYKGGFG